MGYNGGYWPPTTPPAPAPRPKRRLGAVGMFAGLSVLLVAGVGTYVLLNRLSDQVLTIIATVGCAGAMALPGLVLGLVVLLKRAESSGARREAPAQPQMTQPMVMVMPPMALPQYPQQQNAPAMWDSRPVARQFTVVGDGGDGFD